MLKNTIIVTLAAALLQAKTEYFTVPTLALAIVVAAAATVAQEMHRLMRR